MRVSFREELCTSKCLADSTNSQFFFRCFSELSALLLAIQNQCIDLDDEASFLFNVAFSLRSQTNSIRV